MRCSLNVAQCYIQVQVVFQVVVSFIIILSTKFSAYFLLRPADSLFILNAILECGRNANYVCSKQQAAAHLVVSFHGIMKLRVTLSSQLFVNAMEDKTPLSAKSFSPPTWRN